MQVLLRHIKFIQRLRYGPILGRISKMHRLKQESGASFFLLLMVRFYKPIFAATDAAQRSPSIAEETMPPA